MAQITKESLKYLSSQQIKDFFLHEDIKDLPSPIKEYVEGGKASGMIGSRLNRVQRILGIIVLERFINDTL